MKKVILSILVIGAFLSSCSNNASVEAGDAKEVEVVQTETTTELNTVDPSSSVAWRATHLGGVQPRFGKISLKDAKVLVNNGEVTNATIVMNMASITVENFGDDQKSTGELTGHLLSGDFFDVETFRTATFELVEVKAGQGEFNSVVTGNLTIKDVTKSITFNATITVGESNVSIKSEDFSVDRSDWGLTYHAEGSEGVPVDYLIADDIGFTINMKVAK